MRTLAILLSSLGFAASLGAADTTRWSGTSQVSFSGTSTLHDWAGVVPARPFIAVVKMDDAGKPVSIQAKVEVEAGKMDTDEPKRDANMKKAMKAADHPLISASINTPFSAVASANGTPAALPMELTLLGKTHKVQAVVSRWNLQGKKASFDVEFELSLKDCGISVPSVLMVIRVGDRVRVRAPVVLTQN